MASLNSRLSASNIQVHQRFKLFIIMHLTILKYVFTVKSRPGKGRPTKNSVGRMAVAPGPPADDDEICVVEEKLTPLAKMKARVGFLLVLSNRLLKSIIVCSLFVYFFV